MDKFEQRSYYIQPLMAPNWEYHRTNDLFYVDMPEHLRKVLKKICRFYPMGYSEYEHEKTIQSIGRILSYGPLYRGFKKKFMGHNLFVISHWNDQRRIRDDLLYHYKHPHGRMKGFICLKESLEDPNGFLNDAKGWWSYTNDYLVFRDEKMFLAFCEFFGVSLDE